MIKQTMVGDVVDLLQLPSPEEIKQAMVGGSVDLLQLNKHRGD